MPRHFHFADFLRCISHLLNVFLTLKKAANPRISRSDYALPSSIKIPCVGGLRRRRLYSGGCRQEEICCMYINRAGAIRRTLKKLLASYVPQMDAQFKLRLRIEGKRLCSRRDAQINLREVDYAAGMAEIDDYAAEKDALVKLRKEECAADTISMQYNLTRQGGLCCRHGGNRKAYQKRKM